MTRFNRRTLMAATGGAAAAIGLSTGNTAAQGRSRRGRHPRDSYEVWALDQGTNTAHILSEVGIWKRGQTHAFEERARIEDLPTVPHMITFSSDYEYAFIASTAGSAVTVVHTADREIVATIGSGGDVDVDVGVAHFAGITPDDSTMHVDDLGPNTAIHVFDVDLEAEKFEHEESLDVSELLAGEGYPSAAPVCHDYTNDGKYAYVTLGPGFGGAGLFLFDVENNEVAKTYDPEVIRTNCGTVAHPDLDRIYLNGGGGLFDDSIWYTFSTQSHEPLARRGVERQSNGSGAHGVWLTPNGRELWQVNRVTNDGIVTDARRDQLLTEIPQIGPARMRDEPPYDVPYDSPADAPSNPGDKPDILGASPDGKYMFCTLRGLNPKSAGGVSVGENPGVAILSVEDRRRATRFAGVEDGVWKPDGVSAFESDFHGLGVREIR